MNRAMRAWCAAVLLSALAACAARDDRVEPGQDDAGSWLAQMQSAHGRADAALANGQDDAAAEVLRGAIEQPVPRELAPEHARVVMQDLWFRLASVQLAGTPERALLAAERGLALGRHDDLFTSNLHAARGRALQALGRDTEAASSYQEALTIDERLLDAALRRGE